MTDKKSKQKEKATLPAGTSKVYRKFKYQDQEFQCGDTCRFMTQQDEHSPVEDLLGRIISILSTDPNHKDFAKLRVQWLYQKKDLPQEHRHSYISDGLELFPTNHLQNVYVQTINAKCKVLQSVSQFEDFYDNTMTDVYFTRAQFDTKRKCFKPSEDKWTDRLCTCNLPSNPQDTYIQCDACQNWFHPRCQGVAAEVDEFVCSKCDKSQ